MRTFAVLALLASSAMAFVPNMPAARSSVCVPKTVTSSLIMHGGDYSEKVRAIVMENTGDDPKVADYLKATGDDKAEFSEMGFDSLDLVEFSMAIQKEFELPDLSEDDLANLKTIKDVVTLVETNKK